MDSPVSGGKKARNVRTVMRLLRRWVISPVASRVILGWVLLRSVAFGPPRVLMYNSHINVAILRWFGATVGKGVRAHPPITLHACEDGYGNLFLGDGCNLNANVYLDLSGKIVLERGVGIGPGAIINTHNRFNYDEYLEERLSHQCGVGEVIVREGSSVKANALVIMGVTIGRHCVVAGGAVVNRDVPDYSFAVGVPAKVQDSLAPETLAERAGESSACEDRG